MLPCSTSLPSFSTRMRSAIWWSEGSEELRNSTLTPCRARQLLQQPDDLQRDGHVERLGDVVGDDHGGVGRQRIDDHRALHHAAGVFRGVFVEALVRRGNAHLGEELQDLLLGLGCFEQFGLHRAQLLDELRPDGNGGIEAALRA